MTAIDSLITRLAPALQSEVNPKHLRVTVPMPLEAGWRSSPRGDYVIVANSSPRRLRARVHIQGARRVSSLSVVGENRRVGMAKSELIQDNFDPLAVHIYSTS
jgi:hypothetical protein